jgi:hypothetical protein
MATEGGGDSGDAGLPHAPKLARTRMVFTSPGHSPCVARCADGESR